MRGRYIVIAESIIGSHRMESGANTDLTMHALTFLTRIEKIDERFVVRADLKDNKTFRAVMDEYTECKQNGLDASILVSFDLDENGEIMSEAFKNALIFCGVDPFDIFRVPLTENGYVAIKEFSDTSKFKQFLWHQQRVRERLKAKGLPEMGLLKITALSSLYKYRNRPFDIAARPDIINPEGTSTVTFIHNYLNMGENEANKLDKHRFE